MNIKNIILMMLIQQQRIVELIGIITLEDLIEFQKIEFQVIKGYIWNGKRDYKIQKVIQTIFEI